MTPLVPLLTGTVLLATATATLCAAGTCAVTLDAERMWSGVAVAGLLYGAGLICFVRSVEPA